MNTTTLFFQRFEQQRDKIYCRRRLQKPEISEITVSIDHRKWSVWRVGGIVTLTLGL